MNEKAIEALQKDLSKELKSRLESKGNKFHSFHIWTMTSIRGLEYHFRLEFYSEDYPCHILKDKVTDINGIRPYINHHWKEFLGEAPTPKKKIKAFKFVQKRWCLTYRFWESQYIIVGNLMLSVYSLFNTVNGKVQIKKVRVWLNQ